MRFHAETIDEYLSRVRVWVVEGELLGIEAVCSTAEKAQARVEELTRAEEDRVRRINEARERQGFYTSSLGKQYDTYRIIEYELDALRVRFEGVDGTTQFRDLVAEELLARCWVWVEEDA